MRGLVQTADGVYDVDLVDEIVLGFESGVRLDAAGAFDVGLPRLVATATAGSTVVCVVDAKPPLLVSHDAGRSWRESGRGLPPGRAVAIAEDSPDVVLYAARNRLYLSEDGGRFWRSLVVELPEIEAVALAP
jgi:hypothetical protein